MLHWANLQRFLLAVGVVEALRVSLRRDEIFGCCQMMTGPTRTTPHEPPKSALMRQKTNRSTKGANKNTARRDGPELR